MPLSDQLAVSARPRNLKRTATLAVIGLAALVLAACNNGSGDNQAPTIGALPDRSTTLGEPLEVTLQLTDENLGSLAVSATSSNQSVVANANLAVTGSGSSRHLTVTPSSTTTGTTTITVSAQDAEGSTATRSFALEVSEPFGQTPSTLENSNAVPMGVSVGISAEYAAVGAFESVYVFERVNGDWAEMQRISPLVMNGFATNFGGSVDIDGDRIIVGADEDYDGGEDAGAAFIFELQGDTWTEVLKLVDPLPANFDSFGRSVAIDGDYAFVGAQNDVHDGVQSGSVFVYQDDPTFGWGLWGKLGPETPNADQVFGEAVDADGGSLIVGDYADPTRGVEAGSATIFTLDGFVWERETTLTPAELEAGDQFGLSVAIDGGFALVGAWNDDDAAENAGAVYVYQDDGTQWLPTAKLTASDAAAHDAFGGSVALDMPYAVIGAEGATGEGALDNAGAVYVFRYDGEQWHEVAKLESPDPAASAAFGSDVGIALDQLIASQFGAPQLAAIFGR